MTVERIVVPAVRYTDERGEVRHMVPLHDPRDSTWWVLGEDGAGVFASADSARQFADEWASDPHDDDEVDSIAAYRMLADLMEET